ncbi:unnamed protein product [Cylicocyclus nassatus]|uniref:Phospholipase A2 n=1 Tax=Cylicocyclus nassatus TaxID=53992 RepID=A0AA36MC39_CYLNA|nr:unnamed protein product [Cylicocyclus nassatus]
MYIVLVLLSLVYVVMPQHHAAAQFAVRSRDINSLTECVVGYSARRLYDYGCWCRTVGLGTPIDAVDSCCFNLDQCYGETVSSGICNPGERYFRSYKWNCVNKQAVCSPTNTGCAAALCKCDNECAQCWKSTGFIPPVPFRKPQCRK